MQDQDPNEFINNFFSTDAYFRGRARCRTDSPTVHIQIPIEEHPYKNRPYGMSIEISPVTPEYSKVFEGGSLASLSEGSQRADYIMCRVEPLPSKLNMVEVLTEHGKIEGFLHILPLEQNPLEQFMQMMGSATAPPPDDDESNGGNLLN